MEKLVRMKQIIGSKREGIPPIVPASASTIKSLMRKGKFPQPCIREPRFVAWRLSDIEEWIKSLGKED